ncbi:hypothetical protein, partial [Aquimarina addita]|uniref:hypothetical protein n=1 Tax=Aquimarina addita TaxID=870485 RepID=UPI0031E53F2E
SKKRASIIKEALRKDKLGISLAADRKSIDLVKSNNYFERYKAAINGYWDSDLSRFDYDYQYSVSNIENWYQLDLANKETGTFDPTAISTKHIYDYTGLFFTMKSDVDLYLTNFTNVEGGTKIVLTDDFTDATRVAEIEATLTNTKDAGTIIWIHVSKDNKVVQQNLYTKGFKLTLEPTLSKRLEDFGNTVFQGDMSAGKALATLAEMDAILTQFGSVVFGGITDGLNAVQLPKEFWDSAAPGYYFKDVNTWVQGIPVLEEIVKSLQNDIAFISGVYNGLISTAAFVTGTVKNVLDFKAFAKKILSDSEYRGKVYTEAIKIAELITDEDKREAVLILAKVLVVGEVEKGWEYQKNKITDYNLTGVDYFAGNIAFEIVVGVLSGGATAEAGVAKEFYAILKWATDPLEFVIRRGKKFAAPVAKLMAKGLKVATDGAVSIGNKILFKIDIEANKI